MYKELMLLGLLAAHPMYGQQIREVIELHHDAFASFIKKPTMYYQLDRLVAEGLLRLQQAGARHCSLYVDGLNETRAFDVYRKLGFDLAFETEVWEATFR